MAMTQALRLDYGRNLPNGGRESGDAAASNDNAAVDDRGGGRNVDHSARATFATSGRVSCREQASMPRNGPAFRKALLAARNPGANGAISRSLWLGSVSH